MKKIAPFLMALALLFTEDVEGQNGLWAGGGIQASSMDDMIYLQGLILETYPIPGKVTSSFPAYTTISFGYVNQWYPNIRIGAGYSFSATGGRSSYSDYSGYITNTMEATSYGLGAFAAYSLLDADWFELSLSGRIRFSYTQIDISSSIHALRSSSQNSNRYSSVSPGASVGVELLFHLNEISLGVEGGYEADIPGKLSNNENKEDLLDPYDREKVLTSDWTGWFAQLKFIVWLAD